MSNDALLHESDAFTRELGVRVIVDTSGALVDDGEYAMLASGVTGRLAVTALWVASNALLAAVAGPQGLLASVRSYNRLIDELCELRAGFVGRVNPHPPGSEAANSFEEMQTLSVVWRRQRARFFQGPVDRKSVETETACIKGYRDFNARRLGLLAPEVETQPVDRQSPATSAGRMNHDSWMYQLIERLGFRHPEWSRKSECSDESWEGLRSALGGQPPLSFQEFICEFGGARFGTEDHKIRSPIIEPCPWGKGVALEIAYPLVKSNSRSLEAHLNTYRTRLPPGTLPFSDDPGGNLLVLDVAGKFPGSVWFWDHEQRWFTHNIEAAAREVDAAGIDARRMDVHQIIRAWARLHEAEFDRPADYMGMYRIAPDFETFLKSLYKEPY